MPGTSYAASDALGVSPKKRKLPLIKGAGFRVCAVIWDEVVVVCDFILPAQVVDIVWFVLL